MSNIYNKMFTSLRLYKNTQNYIAVCINGTDKFCLNALIEAGDHADIHNHIANVATSNPILFEKLTKHHMYIQNR